MAHFFYIHHAYPTYFKNVIEGHTASQFMESKPRPDYTADPDKLWDGTYLRSEATYFGPAYMINWLHNDLAPGFTVEVALINCHYPVTHNSFMLQWGVAVQEMPGLPAGKAAKLAAEIAELGFNAKGTDDLEGACKSADLISCATLSTEPLVRGDWLREGTIANSFL